MGTVSIRVTACGWLGLFQDTGEPLVFKDKTARVDLDSLYDPCFLLHLFGELTRPGECAVGCLSVCLSILNIRLGYKSVTVT